MHICRASSIGHIAHESLQSEREAEVMARSGRGIFLRTPCRRIVFISPESLRGPLTITLADPMGPAWNLPPRMQAVFVDGELIFAGISLHLVVPPERVWRLPAPTHEASPAAERLERVKEAGRAAMSRLPDAGLGYLIIPLLGLAGPKDWSAVRQAAFQSVQGYQQAMARRSAIRAAKALEALLGLGEGLTPSGDDLIVGLLLAINRWPNQLWRGDDREAFNAYLINAARSRTTDLAWNMIECAALGQANERLANVVDGLMSGRPSHEECLRDLLEWGASSGFDCFLGIALAITAAT